MAFICAWTVMVLLHVLDSMPCFATLLHGVLICADESPFLVFGLVVPGCEANASGRQTRYCMSTAVNDDWYVQMTPTKAQRMGKWRCPACDRRMH